MIIEIEKLNSKRKISNYTMKPCKLKYTLTASVDIEEEGYCSDFPDIPKTIPISLLSIDEIETIDNIHEYVFPLPVQITREEDVFTIEAMVVTDDINGIIKQLGNLYEEDPRWRNGDIDIRRIPCPVQKYDDEEIVYILDLNLKSIDYDPYPNRNEFITSAPPGAPIVGNPNKSFEEALLYSFIKKKGYTNEFSQ